MKKISVLAFFLLLLSEAKAQKIEVLATTGMIADIVQNISQEKISFHTMMAAGVDPHSYKPSARDLRRIQQAKVIFYNGFHLEANLSRIFETMKKAIPICEQVEKTHLIQGIYETPDPHLWMDVALWKKCVATVSLALQKNFPDFKKEIKKNTQDYQKKLDDLDFWVREQVKKIPLQKRILVTAHDAFGYFGKAYQFQVRGIQGISTVSEVGIKDIKDLADFVSAQKIPTIFLETSAPQHNIIALQKAILARGWKVEIGESLFSDSMGSPKSGKNTYLAMIKHNARSIVKGLTQK